MTNLGQSWNAVDWLCHWIGAGREKSGPGEKSHMGVRKERDPLWCTVDMVF